jgi:hypothetical protein
MALFRDTAQKRGSAVEWEKRYQPLGHFGVGVAV